MIALTRALSLLAASWLALASSSSASSASSAQAKGRKAGSDPKAVVEGEAGAKLDAAVRSFLPDPGFCGAVLVAARGKVLLEKGYGLFDAATSKEMPADALFDWASTSKQFTAAALLKLQDQKKLKLDDPIAKFFKSVPKDKAKITLRHLLNQTSGLPKGFREEWEFDSSRRESFEELMLGLTLESEPGRKFEYNNAGYALAAAIVERVSGQRFEEFCVENLFKPAGMKSATFIGTKELDLRRVPKFDRGKGFPDRPPEDRFAYSNVLSWGYRGCGGAVASVHDMYLWDRALRGRTVLSPAAIKEYYEPALDNYALGWRVDHPRGLLVEHGGDVRGFHCEYRRYLDADVCIALMASFEPANHDKEDPSILAERLSVIALNFD